MRANADAARAQEGRQVTRKEGDVVERFIGYLVSFAVIAGMGVALPRWFEWRRSFVERWPGERKNTAQV